MKRQIESFVEQYTHERYCESLNTITPADIYLGRAQSILAAEKKSRIELSNTDACSTAKLSLNINQRGKQSLSWTGPKPVPFYMTTDNL